MKKSEELPNVLLEKDFIQVLLEKIQINEELTKMKNEIVNQALWQKNCGKRSFGIAFDMESLLWPWHWKEKYIYFNAAKETF